MAYKQLKADEPHQDEAAQIMAEIAERIIELKQSTSASRVIKWIGKINQLAKIQDGLGLWLYMDLQTGDMTRIKASYTDQAERYDLGPVTKQAVHKQQHVIFRQISDIMPQLGEVLASLVSHRMGTELS